MAQISGASGAGRGPIARPWRTAPWGMRTPAASPAIASRSVAAGSLLTALMSTGTRADAEDLGEHFAGASYHRHLAVGPRSV